MKVEVIVWILLKQTISPELAHSHLTSIHVHRYLWHGYRNFKSQEMAATNKLVWDMGATFVKKITDISEIWHLFLFIIQSFVIQSCLFVYVFDVLILEFERENKFYSSDLWIYLNTNMGLTIFKHTSHSLKREDLIIHQTYSSSNRFDPTSLYSINILSIMPRRWINPCTIISL